MNQPLLPAAAPTTSALTAVTAVAPVASAAPVASGVPAVVVPPAELAPAQAAAPAAPTQPATQPATPVAPATPAPHISAQAQQALRLQVFQTLIAQLVTQVQSSNPALAPQWPTSGVPTALREMLATLIAQATASLGQPQQLVAVQPWPQTWLNAVLPAAAPATLPAQASATAPAPAAGPQAAMASAAPGAATAASAAPPRLPPMLTWLVQQGVVQAPDGERGFALTLQVPQAWAQMQAMALPAGVAASGAALPLTAPAAQLQLPFAAPAQQLESGALALVLQGAAPGGERMRTSALLWLDFAPLPAAAQAVHGTPSAAALASLLPSTQMAQQLVALQTRNDPWLQLAALQASGQLPREDQRLEERRTGLCTELGCPYRAKASCAQPFCAEMNRVWAAVRIGPTGA